MSKIVYVSISPKLKKSGEWHFYDSLPSIWHIACTGCEDNYSEICREEDPNKNMFQKYYPLPPGLPLLA